MGWKKDLPLFQTMPTGKPAAKPERRREPRRNSGGMAPKIPQVSALQAVTLAEWALSQPAKLDKPLRSRSREGENLSEGRKK